MKHIRVHTNIKPNQVHIWLNSLLYMIYKTVMNNYLSVQSIDTTFEAGLISDLVG